MVIEFKTKNREGSTESKRHGMTDEQKKQNHIGHFEHGRTQSNIYRYKHTENASATKEQTNHMREIGHKIKLLL